MRIPAGGERSLMTFAFADPVTCRSETPAVRILQAPLKGPARIAVKKEPVNKVGHPCHGRSVEQTVLFYRPRDATVTSDVLVVHRSGTPSNPRDQTYSFDISVFQPAPGASTAPLNRLPPSEQARRGEGTYEGGIPMSARSREMLRSASAPETRTYPRRYQPPPVPMLRTIPAR